MRRLEYITDFLHGMGSVKVPPAARVTPELKDYLADASGLAEWIKGREIYSFTRKALLAASDLRVDSPERMERLVEAVTREPRRVFLEASMTDLLECLSDIRGFVRYEKDPRFTGSDRIGFRVDVDDQGIMSFRMLSLWSRERVAEWVGERPQLREAVRHAPPKMRERVLARARLVSPHISGLIDIRRHVGMSRAEFEQVLERAGQGDEMLSEARSEIAAAGGSRQATAALDLFWRMSRFRDIVTVMPEEGRPPELAAEQIMSLPADLVSPMRIGLHVIAMLAILSADAREIAFYRPGDLGSSDRRSESAASGRPGTDTPAGRDPSSFGPRDIRVVSLNVDIPERNAPGDTSPAADHHPDHGSGAPRTRHPVRGHLFLARNGKIVWRKPHWRGSLEKPVIHRVTTA